jgi:Peptidase family M49
MRRNALVLGVLGTLFLTLAGCGPAPGGDGVEESLVIAPDVSDRLAQFALTTIDADRASLSESEQRVLSHLLAASGYMEAIFLRQAWADNPNLKRELEGSGDPLAAAARDYFRIQYGPWDRLTEEPFLGAAHRPETAGYYPPDLTKEEFEAWIEAHPEDEEAFLSLYTVIKRQGDALVAVPYSQEYAQWLEPAAEELLAAAEVTENESLARYLRAVAVAFGEDDYYESDLAWMDLDSRVEVTIGPYETYEDRLFGYKAAFESFLTLADPVASQALAQYKEQLPAMERNLPIPDQHKNFDRGTESPIRVVDEIYTAGDTRAGVQTIAYNLPNDERVREAKGSKKVMLRNVMNAKFQQILRPIAERILDPEQRLHLAQEQFFNETLFHELSHGLGPGRIVVDGEETEVRHRLLELYSPSEEAKADVMGVYNILFLIDQGLYPEDQRHPLFVTYLAGMFRSTRFGISEAHGKGTALQFNYLLEKGAIREVGEGTFAVQFDQFEDGIRSLVRDLCMLQATGDYEGTKAFFERYGVLSEPLDRGIQSLEGIPVDIRPFYPAAEG